FVPLLTAAAEKRDALLSGAAGLCTPLLTPGEQVPDTLVESEFPLLHGLHWLAANAAERAPLLLVVDDAHWADPPSLRFLLSRRQGLAELAIAMLITERPEEAGVQGTLTGRIAGHELATVVQLQPLSGQAVARLVRLEVDCADEELCAGLAAASGGNPFYVRQLVAVLSAGQGADGAALDGEPVGRTIQARIARLHRPARRLASAAAVLGDGAPLERAAKLSGLKADEAAKAADALAAATLLEPGAPLSFVHPIVREAVYDDLPAAQRARSHARAAGLLRDAGADAELIASHLVEAHRTAGRLALPALGHAPRQA